MMSPERQVASHCRPFRPAVGLLMLAFTALFAGCRGPTAEPASSKAEVGSGSPYSTTVPRQVKNNPIRIEIPAIDVDAEIVPVGLKKDGAMETPEFGLAGWYNLGPRPGERGPAVIVAHVDSKAGPDVFFRLRELRRTDFVVVVDAKGTRIEFAVEQIEQAPKNQLPVQRIWGSTDKPSLRLLTCGGRFDRKVGHYEDNVIIYASSAHS